MPTTLLAWRSIRSCRCCTFGRTSPSPTPLWSGCQRRSWINSITCRYSTSPRILPSWSRVYAAGPNTHLRAHGRSAYVQADGGGDYLYVPNMRDPKQPGVFKVGRFALDETGMPRLDDDKDAKLPPPARLKRLAELNAATPLTPAPNIAGNTLPVSLQQNRLRLRLYPGLQGCRDCRRLERHGHLEARRQAHRSQRPVHSVVRRQVHLWPSPAAPFVYATMNNSDTVFRKLEQADGNLSQLPQALCVSQRANLTSPPAILEQEQKAGRRRAGHRVYAVDLDEQGGCRPELIEVQVLNPAVMGLVYSERHDRLYVNVEISK